ncbi:MAG: hypothetical protein AAF747_07590, partial [Planctomycetota bacterium]
MKPFANMQSSRRAGFSVVEVLVAVGAVAIVAVAIAGLFDAVGRTVQTGRTVSRLNETALRIETAMREDFANLTRDGVMLIRHELVGIPGDANAFRADEIVFFAQGEYSSKRPGIPQIYGDRLATGDAARIYWGHGVSYAGLAGREDTRRVFQNPNGQIGLLVRDPDLDSIVEDVERLRADVPPAERLLARHVTVLAEPLPGFADTQISNFRDSDVQIAGRDASPSIFRFNSQIPRSRESVVNANFRRAARGSYQTIGEQPNFEYGLVDVAVTNLDRIRAIINDAGAGLGAASTTFPPKDIAIEFQDLADLPATIFDITTPNPLPLSGGTILDGLFNEPNSASTPNDLLWKQAWMRELLPAPSFTRTTDDVDSNSPRDRRIRVERFAPNPLGPLTQAQPAQAIAAADQAMLSSHLAGVGVTDFIIEFAYRDSANNTFEFYGLDEATKGFDAFDSTTARGGAMVPPTFGSAAVTPEEREVLLYGIEDGTARNQADELIAHFGYFDPFVPQERWPWPRFIRVTMT